MAWSKRDLVLAGSVAVNLLLVGFVVGAGARLSGQDPPRGGRGVLGASYSTRALMENLPPEERRRVRQAVVGEGARSAPLFRDLRDARRDFETSVAAEPFDAQGARAALDRVREIERQLQARSGELMIAILSELPPEERAEFVRDLRDRPRRWRDRRDRDGGPPPAPDEAPQR